jgi:hypothetical protein
MQIPASFFIVPPAYGFGLVVVSPAIPPGMRIELNGCPAHTGLRWFTSP